MDPLIKRAIEKILAKTTEPRLDEARVRCMYQAYTAWTRGDTVVGVHPNTMYDALFSRGFVTSLAEFNRTIDSLVAEGVLFELEGHYAITMKFLKEHTGARTRLPYGVLR